MKKVISLLVILISLSAADAVSIFSGYDFTFFKSVAESIAISDSERIGIDYTGYGYLGDMTTGVFLRLGLQAPYSTLLYTLDDLIGGSEQEGSMSDQNQNTFESNPLESKTKEYTLLFAIGPAFRRMVSPTLSWYMGLGLKLEIDNTTFLSDASLRNVNIAYSASTDIDFGFRITTDIHTTLRIGIYMTRPLFVLNQSYFVRESRKSESEFEFIQNIYPNMNVHDSTTNFIGYISLGHTYTSYIEKETYRYTITTRNIGEGILEVM